MTPGRAALGTLLRWGYWACGAPLGGLAANIAVAATDTRGWIGVPVAIGAGGVLGLVLLAWRVKCGSRMADRVHRQFADLAEEWGQLSGRLPDRAVTSTDAADKAEVER